MIIYIARQNQSFTVNTCNLTDAEHARGNK